MILAYRLGCIDWFYDRNTCSSLSRDASHLVFFCVRLCMLVLTRLLLQDLLEDADESLFGEELVNQCLELVVEQLQEHEERCVILMSRCNVVK